MARALANVLLKGIAGLAAARSTSVHASLVPDGLRCSTTIPNDPDTHGDFKPTNKIENSDFSMNDVVEQDVKNNSIMIYMKWIPDLFHPGSNSLAIEVLKHYKVPLKVHIILINPKLTNAVKTFSHCRRFPQIFIKGEFIGGSDILLRMHQTGELKEKLKDIEVVPLF